MRSCPQDQILQSPVTPVSVEALTSLHNLIKQDAHTLDETSIQRLQRHVQKLANAAHTFFAERVLLNDRIQFLSRMNDEAKRRRSTRAVVSGKAKVMSYEEPIAKRAERDAKDQAKAKGKVKRDRKNFTPEAEEIVAGKENLSRKRKSIAREADAPESSKSPSGVDERSARSSGEPSRADERSARARKGPGGVDGAKRKIRPQQ